MSAFIMHNPGIIAIIVIWSLLWKGIALWRAAHKNELGWFIALLVINTLGILEIVYIYYVHDHKISITPTEGTH